MSMSSPSSPRRVLIADPQGFAGGLVLAAIGLAALWLSRDLSMGTLRNMGPGMFPRVLGGGLGALGLIITLVSLRVTGHALERWSLRGLACVLGAIVLFGLTIRGGTWLGVPVPPLGLAVAGPLALFIGGFATHEAKAGQLAIMAIAMTAFCIALFRFALGLPIPVAPWLLGY